MRAAAAAPAPAGWEEDLADGTSDPSPVQPGAAANPAAVWPFEGESARAGQDVGEPADTPAGTPERRNAAGRSAAASTAASVADGPEDSPGDRRAEAPGGASADTSPTASPEESSGQGVEAASGGTTADPPPAADAATAAAGPRPRKPATNARSAERQQKLKVLRKRLLVGGIAAAATLCALGALAIALREPIVGILPGAAGVYTALGLVPDPIGDGLEIREVVSTRDREGGDDVLTIRGVVANVATGIQPLPPLRVSLWNASDEEVQFVTVSHGSGRLAPGESVTFEARIVEPRPEARILRVGFAPPGS